MMKKTKLALAISATTLFASSAMATNGTNMVGLGAQSVATGGTGVAAFYGAENVVVNPAMIGKIEDSEVTFAGTLFMPDVKTDSTGLGGDKAKSKADMFLIPSVSLASRVNGNWTFGIGMYGTSGMGTDYRGDGKNIMPNPNMGSATLGEIFDGVDGMAQNDPALGAMMQQMMQDPGFAGMMQDPNIMGMTMDQVMSNPQMMQQFGGMPDQMKQAMLQSQGIMNSRTNLQIMRFVPTIAYNADNFGFGFSPIVQYGSLDISVGGQSSGVSDDLGFGFSIGGFYDLTDDLTVAASYTSAIEMKYKDTLSAFGLSDKLEQPQEIKLGVAYTMGKMTYTADYKHINWKDAKGFKDFGWEDQDVISLGAQYKSPKFWAGVGYNYAESPIRSKALKSNFGLANNILFPAVTEHHITFGGGYNLTKAVAVEGAIMMALEESTKAEMMGMENKTKHSQTAVTLGLRYSF